MVKVSLKKLDGTVVEKTLEKPKYGGTINVVYYLDTASFDPLDVQGATGRVVTSYVYEKMQTGDYSRSPLGTNEYDFTHFFFIPVPMRVGCLAESWEQPDPQTVIWHVRKGIKFHNVPPVNGREMTAEDVAYSILRQKSSPRISPKFYGDVVSAVATDKYTVTIKLSRANYNYIEQTGDGSVCPIYAKEMVAKYGNLNEPVTACGTGPWMLENYVRGSVVTYKKNPDYWRKDPIFTENTLPYADYTKVLIIPDFSTEVAGLRSGKIDFIIDHQYWQDAESLKKTDPEINQQAYVYTAGSLSIMWRVDQAPFDNIKVRQALTIAVDQEAILKDFLNGGALFQYPTMAAWGEDLYTPIEKMPKEPSLPGSAVGPQLLFKYNPTLAKQLLTEAGYPNGFTTKIICLQQEVDATALVVAYWKAIGVNATIDVKDAAVKSMIVTAKPRTFDGIAVQAVQSSGPTGAWSSEYITNGSYNVGNISDPRIDDDFAKIISSPPDVAAKIHKDLTVYVTEQAYKLAGPHGYRYNFWQPWLKNCTGGSRLSAWGQGESIAHMWVDQDLKAQMTGR